MEQFPNIEGENQKVYRIARELGISFEDAAVTCAGFELAFSDERLRRAIFRIIEQLDEEAVKNGEPLGMILSYAVELGMDGVSVTRHANEIPPGKVVSLTPANRAMIFVRIQNNFPTQRFLGPLMVYRPGWKFETRSRESEFESERSERQFGRENFRTEVPNGSPPHRPAKAVICLGPIRPKLNERFPFLTSAGAQSNWIGAVTLSNSAGSRALKPSQHQSRWVTLLPAFRSTSGLSPPRPSEIVDTPHRKMSPGPLAITLETCVLTS